MKKLLPILLASLVVSAPAMAFAGTQGEGSEQPVVKAGKMVVDAKGARLAPVLRVSGDGSPQIIFQGKVVTIPVSTISVVEGKLTTSLSKADVLAMR